MAQTALAYELRPLNPPEDMRTTAVLTCAGCTKLEKLPIMGFGNNPEKIEKAFIRMGWRCNVHKRSDNFCPRCMREKAIREPEKKKEEVVLVSASPSTMGLIQAGMANRISSPGVADMTGIKDLTTDQKFALRQALDHTFDDKAGRYIDGTTDHTLSEKLSIPRAVLIEFRELMFGPLKEDPMIASFRDQLASAKHIMAGLQSSIAKMEDTLSAISKKNGL